MAADMYPEPTRELARKRRALAPEQQSAADPRLANLMAMPLAQDAPRGRPDR